MLPVSRLTLSLLLAVTFAAPFAPGATASVDLWARENLVAWCIVPYDAAKRDPVARAAMLQELGFRHFAYDWRPEHVATFEDEIVATAARGVTISAWWFPRTLDDTAKKILTVLERHGLRPQLWVTGGGEPTTSAADQEKRIEQELARLRPIVQAAARIGCTVGLYNHGGWFGEPDHQIVLLHRLRAEQLTNVRLVYNFHHGHDHLADFAARWTRMAPYVDTVNLNGMVANGDRTGKKILTVGEGDQELALLRVIHDSGWRGRLGILNHRTDVDAAVGLRRNLDGLDLLVARLRAAR